MIRIPLRTILGVILIGGAMWLCRPVEASSISYKDGIIYLEGEIQNGDADKLQKLIDMTNASTLDLNSNGGVALAGYSLGYTINRNNLYTTVSEGNVCLSACATAFIGGNTLTSNGVVGFHVAWSPNTTSTYSEGMKSGQYLGAIDSAYHFNMGYIIQLQFIVAQLTDSETFLVVNTDDLKLFEMVDNKYTTFIDLPKNWLYERIADPLRLHLLKGGY
tara:strand:- start:520 stop:1173 length:654 start_codon:yes stop_codon:yes gene_type:complete